MNRLLSRSLPLAGAWLLAAVSAPACAIPLISEVLYDATGTDNGLVFVELWGAPGTPLDGLVLEGVNGADGSITTTVALSGTIPGSGFFVVADDAGDGTTGVPGAHLVQNFDFQNGPDSVVLSDGDMVLDALGYGEFAMGEVFAGEGFPAPDPSAGASLARVFADVDTDDNLADFEILDAPTPGSGPTLVSEPPQTLLLTGALGTLALVSRRSRGRDPLANP